MFAIVKFKEENDAPGIVCTHWIYSDGNMCFYPNVKTNEARDKLLRKVAQPAHDWISCQIEILHEYSSFNEAMMHLRKAEETSNLESDDDIVNMRRKKVKRRMLYPGESDDENPTLTQKSVKKSNRHMIYPGESSDDENQTLTQKSVKKFNIEPYPTPYEDSVSLLEPQNASHSMSLSSFLTNTIRDINKPFEPLKPISTNKQFESPLTNISARAQISKSPSCSSSQTVINGRLIAWMADISEKVFQMNDKIDMLLHNQAELLKQNEVDESSNKLDLKILEGLPITDDNSFVQFNNRIGEENNFRQLLVKVLMSVGGKDMRCHIQHMLRKVISDEVAELYTLSGKSTLKNITKKPFLVTEVSKAIFCACQKVFKDATEMKMREAVGDWLNQAKVRKNRRIQRQEKLIEETIFSLE